MPKRSARLSRSTGRFALPTLLVVYSEGETETRALQALKQAWRVPNALIECIPNAGDPSKILEKAKERVKADRACACWVVFDKDKHDRWAEAINDFHQAKRKRSNLHLGISTPCIELWGILLFRDHKSEISHPEAQSALRKEDPSYHHKDNPYIDAKKVEAGHEAAAERARELRKIAEQNVTETGDAMARYGNPTTYFDLVVEALRSRRRT